VRSAYLLVDFGTCLKLVRWCGQRVIAKEQCCESRRQDSALDLRLASSVSQRSLHDGWEQHCAETHAIGIEDR
jgi:hypothetical protein